MINLFKRHKFMIVLIVGLFIIIGGFWWQRELVKQYDGLVMAIVTTILIATTMYYSWLTKEIVETYNTPNIKITIEPHLYAIVESTESLADSWYKPKLEGNFYTIAIENIGTGAAKEVKITKDPLGAKLNEVLQNSTIYPKQRFELQIGKEAIEENAIDGCIEYKISYKSLTNKEKKGCFKIPITAIKIVPVPTLEYDITLISRSIRAIAQQYTGRDMQQEMRQASEDLGNILNNKE